MKPQRAAPLTAPLVYADRLFPADFATRAVARRLYAEVQDLPIVSPHGHTDPRWYAENEPFPDPARLFVTPDHYVFRMLYSQGVTLEDLGIPRRDGGPVETDARKIWRTFAEHYHLFRGTPTRLWLDHAFAELFGIDGAAVGRDRRPTISTASASASRKPEFRPRALFERFNIEVIATTESPLDPLAAPRRDQRVRLEGPRGHGLSARPGRRSRVRRLRGQRRSVRRAHRLRHLRVGTAISKRTAMRRAYFKEHGRDLDRSRPPDGADRRSRRSGCRAAVRQGRLAANSPTADAELFRGADADRNGAHEPRRRAGDADPPRLVAQPQSAASTRRFGRDKGADIPTRTDYVRALKPLLDRFGNERDLTLILFTLDETAYSRELAPLAGHYPALRLGPPWWFYDSPEGMRRFRELATETAGFYNTVGFNDDTRAFLLDPGAARCGAARRLRVPRRTRRRSTGSTRTRRARSRAILPTISRKKPTNSECRGVREAALQRSAGRSAR